MWRHDRKAESGSVIAGVALKHVQNVEELRVGESN